ncbi:peptidoglycan-associated lipoprotein [Candidatus Photodesmus blepharus]|uniref:Peptidoglycan-associated protein n=1 Tax=Candidatus Photodesmus blepharonis TaxID=1179155 RepID=A0A084CPB6_9GAMM|nr:peptidoglycan-associated lipoprotein Pal [Candidatus Photodesmus blepharus]KEY91645.1 peptidoglycan-associated lipoprotein [Candidatus Photodesmus blepharus]
MQFSNFFKGVFFVLSMLSLIACSSSYNNDEMFNSNSKLKQSKFGLDTSVVSVVDENREFTEEEYQEKFLRENKIVYFAFDDFVITKNYEEMLSYHAAYLSKNTDVQLTIEGHADERGTPEYNIALGERRAKSVADYLQALGVQAEQISLVSYGEEKPILLGQSEDAYAKNRRAVLVY